MAESLMYLFQSTLPARGSDNAFFAQAVNGVDFNPRSPQGGATRYTNAVRLLLAISIHAPRKGERRSRLRARLPACADFNPRSPQGGATLLVAARVSEWFPFQSTLPARGSDASSPACTVMFCGFQSTLPARGSDEGGFGCYLLLKDDFNPRSPQGGATSSVPLAVPAFFKFQSTLPARGSDVERSLGRDGVLQISIHAPRKGERLPSLM